MVQIVPVPGTVGVDQDGLCREYKPRAKDSPHPRDGFHLLCLAQETKHSCRWTQIEGHINE